VKDLSRQNCSCASSLQLHTFPRHLSSTLVPERCVALRARRRLSIVFLEPWCCGVRIIFAPACPVLHSATNTNHQVQLARTTPRREIEVRLICVEFSAHAATGSICRAEQKYHSDATPPRALGGRARVWHSTAQHSTAQGGLAEVVRAGLGTHGAWSDIFFFFFRVRGLREGGKMERVLFPGGI
jgi:hypothetical protein